MLGWLNNLFTSNGNSLNARRKTAMSTHDAFSLPTSSPVNSMHPRDSFARYGSPSPDPESSSNAPSYAYPPPSSSSSPTNYDYIPSFKSSRSRPSSLLPLHNNTPLSPLPPYPPLVRTWARIRNWLSKEYPELEDTLNWGILPEDLAGIEVALGTSLPQPVRESYLAVNGQEAESAAGCSEGLFFGLTFLPLEDVLEEWRFWREVDDDPSTGANARLREVMQSIPPGWVRRVYSQRGWIPLVSDKAGNYLGIDLAPDEQGAVGQVIVFGRDFDTKVVMWKGDGPGGWATWLASFADELESGEGFELGAVSDGSEGSEDGIGYESYFFDGTARAKGEGGGDAGTGGLRLTGEYRGWSVLDALADRSLRKWREAGLLPDVAPPQQKGNAKLGLGVLQVAPPVTQDNGTNAEQQDPPTPTASSSRTSTVADSSSTTSARTTKPQVPTISVTKARAPQPVPLPSPRDLEFGSPPSSRETSFDRDLELGRQTSLDETEHSPDASVPKTLNGTTTGNSGKKALREVLASDSGVAISTSGETSPIATESPSKAAIPPPDLLHTDSSDGVPITPLEPALPNTSDAAERSVLTSTDEPSPSMADESTSAKVDVSPEPTIRLIGVAATELGEKADAVFGSRSGAETRTETASPPTAQNSKPVTRRLDDTAETASIASVGTTDSPRASIDKTPSSPSPKPKHEKKRSLTSGLKRISLLGGGNKRRTESKEQIP